MRVYLTPKSSILISDRQIGLRPEAGDLMSFQSFVIGNYCTLNILYPVACCNVNISLFPCQVH